MSVSISQITFEHHREPFGIAEREPRVSWRFQGDVIDWQQQAYDLEVERGLDGSNIYSVNVTESLYVPWPDPPLKSAESARVRVRAHGLENQPSTDWSDWCSVETGLLDSSDWGAAVPIAADRDTELDAPKRPVHFRTNFDVNGTVISARLYITALGLYEAEINNKRVGDHVLAPGWQSYNYRHVYDTYDVTEHITSGDNAIGVLVGEGWYAGRLGHQGGKRNLYGDTLGLLAQLIVTTEDGTQHFVPTNTDWRASLGPLTGSEIYNGEKYDARQELDGWSSSGYDDGDCLAVKQLPALKGQLVPADGPPVRKMQEVKPVAIFKSPSGKTIVDFGQNLVGWLRLNVSARAGSSISSGTNITLHHAEVLQNGELDLEPLRNATAVDTLILADNKTKIWEPRFTFHGFRYAQVDGFDPVNDGSILAVVVHSDMEPTGFFECSNPLLNKFHNNVRWSMKGNFLSIPTDCPQRDERLGWSGDAHVFATTANYLYNTAGFWRGWHKDLWSEQQRNGTMVVPFVVPVVPVSDLGEPAAVWGDVAVVNPYNHYQAFGDLDMLAEQYDSARAWVDIGISRNDVGLWNRTSWQFGDWLDPKNDRPSNATTGKYLVADSYLIHVIDLLAAISSTLGHQEAAEAYTQQQAKLLREFRKAWIPDYSTPANKTQTAYALAIDFGIFQDPQEFEQAGIALRDIVADNDYLVGTGFAGTPSLGKALNKVGGTDDFYKMLLQTRSPSWLYQVAMNGTTTWERWDSLQPNGTTKPGGMTSFNHYAFGAVADWIHTNIGGLAPADPGWKRVTIAPLPGGGLTHANSKFISPYGDIVVKWHFEMHGNMMAAAHRNGYYLEVQLPPNTGATVVVPRGRENGVLQFKEPVDVGSGYHSWFVAGYNEP